MTCFKTRRVLLTSLFGLVVCSALYSLIRFTDFPSLRPATSAHSETLLQTEPPKLKRKLTVMFSTWRSGSSFTADLVSSPNGSFYFYEPLEQMCKYKTNCKSREAVREIVRFHSCKFLRTKVKLWHMNQDLQYLRTGYIYAETPNKTAVRDNCLSKPLQVMKILRKNSEFMEDVLEAVTDFEVRGFYLARDPRATWNSRRRHKWCEAIPACYQPRQMCLNLTRNYYQAQELMKKYPGKFTVVRFEDLSRDIPNKTQELFRFLDLPYEQPTRDFIASHTKEFEGDSFSTFRNSSAIATFWMRQLNFNMVKKIQESCEEAMRLWGYRLVESKDQLTPYFDPVASFSI